MPENSIQFAKHRPAWACLNRAILDTTGSLWEWTAGRRKRSLALAAVDLDLTYHEDARDLVNQWLSRFPLFRAGRGGAIQDGLKGRFLNAPLRLFDYCPRDHNAWRTVVAFELRHTRVPRFVLWPNETPVDPSSWLGKNGRQIPVPRRPVFDQHYRLYASNEPAVKKIFHRQPLDYFQRHAGWFVEGGGQWIVIYRPGIRARPRALRAFLMDVFQAYRPLRLKQREG